MLFFLQMCQDQLLPVPIQLIFICRCEKLQITLLTGRAHQKHTEGGDFRQATYRAVRQGLKKAETLLLEPYYSFRLEVPAEM